MGVLDRYATAIRSSNLAVSARTECSDSDVIGAAGLAGKRWRLALLIQRLYLGDNSAAREIEQWLAKSASMYAWTHRIKLRSVECVDIARATLAWHRHGICGACHGHGYRLIPGTPALSGDECPECHGTGRTPFDRQFDARFREVARHILAELESQMSVAGPAIMAALAPRLEL